MAILWVVGVLAVMIGVAIFLEARSSTQTQFADFRDQITVVNSDFSQHVAGSNLVLSVVGILTNRADKSWKEIGVEAQFLDKSGKLIDAITASADSYRGVAILPHAEAAFKIEGNAARPRSDYETYKVIVRWAKDANSW